MKFAKCEICGSTLVYVSLTLELASDKLALESSVQIRCLERTVLRKHFKGASVCGRVRVSVGAHVIRWHTSYKLFVSYGNQGLGWSGLAWIGDYCVKQSDSSQLHFSFS